MRIVENSTHEGVQIFRFGSLPVGKPSFFSHVFYVDGLLIDTGHSNMRKEVYEAVKDLPVQQLLLTHHHEDHTGNLPLLHKHFACPAYASASCIDLMKRPPAISLAQRISWGSRPSYTDFTLHPEKIHTPNYHFEVIPIPGHAPDMVALYEPRKKWLFSADLYVNHYIGYFLRNESVREQIVSIRRVLELDFEVLFCSHNPQLVGGKEKLVKKLAFLEDFYAKVAPLCVEGATANQIFRQVGLKEKWSIRLLSQGHLSKLNMVKAVMRDEGMSRGT
ncbi:MAG: MBL fold metallo-hydrolase [Bacteroidota bacterium]